MAGESAKTEPSSGPISDPVKLPPMVSFVAPSGTGKTTMLEQVIAGLVDLGHRIGAVKHDAHRIELDTDGKDSWRLRQAGAASTLLVGQHQLAFFGSDVKVPNLEQVVALFQADHDLIVVEGYRSAGLPCVVVTRPGCEDGRWEPPPSERVLLTVTPDQVERTVSFLVATFLSD